MKTDTAEYKFQLDNQFFTDLDAPEVQKGNLFVVLHVTKKLDVYLLDFHTEGMVVVTCDRCLDEMEQPIHTLDRLKVKLGTTFAEEGDIVTVPEEDGYIDVAWLIYEFIVLNIPIKHVHAWGQCNEGMMSKLNKHLCTSGDDDGAVEASMEESDGEVQIDPRWNELKKILDNN